MKKWKLAAGLLLVFTLGVLSGVLGTGMVLKRHHPFFSHKPEGRKAFLMKRLTRKLDLSEDQKDRIAAIIDRMQGEMITHFREGRRFRHQHLEKGFAEIRKELNPDQQRRFDELKAERERHWKKRRERFPLPWLQEEDT